MNENLLIELKVKYPELQFGTGIENDKPFIHVVVPVKGNANCIKELLSYGFVVEYTQKIGSGHWPPLYKDYGMEKFLKCWIGDANE
jgi:hypothetical protein